MDSATEISRLTFLPGDRIRNNITNLAATLELRYPRNSPFFSSGFFGSFTQLPEAIAPNIVSSFTWRKALRGLGDKAYGFNWSEGSM